jgi:hypothetical protein
MMGWCPRRHPRSPRGTPSAANGKGGVAAETIAVFSGFTPDGDSKVNVLLSHRVTF